MIIKEIPITERPYEKFLDLGAESLSDAELLAIIIKSGTANFSALDIARELLKERNHSLLNLYDLTFEELCKFPGIGKVKAIQLKAIAELSKRISHAGYNRGEEFCSAKKIAGYYMERMRHMKSEIVISAFFDSKMHLLEDEIYETGTGNHAFFPIKQILKKAVMLECINLVIIHNHPSGNPTPSEDDIRLTKRFATAANLMDFKLIDHIIIGDQNYYSFNENNLI